MNERNESLFLRRKSLVEVKLCTLGQLQKQRPGLVIAQLVMKEHLSGHCVIARKMSRPDGGAFAPARASRLQTLQCVLKQLPGNDQALSFEFFRL